MVASLAERVNGSWRAVHWPPVVAGALVGACAVLGFGVVHAIAIVPIWSRLVGGLPFALVAGAVMGGSAGYLRRDLGADVAGMRRVLVGPGLGVLVWCAVLPAVAWDTLRRLHLLPTGWEPAGDAAVIALAALGALGLARALGARWKPAAVFALACVVLLAASGGPIPISNGPRAFGLFAGVTLVWWFAGVALDAVLRRLPAVASGA